MKNLTENGTIFFLFEIEELEQRLENKWKTGDDCAEGLLNESNSEPCEESLKQYF
jgi:hypothetical protein